MRKLMVFLLFALFAATSTQALAEGRHPRDRVRNGEIQPLDRILSNVRGSHPGTFYDADGPFPDGRGGYRYRIKWLTPEGRVIWLDTDARTGRVIGTDRSDRSSHDDRANQDRDSDSRPRDPWGKQRDNDDRDTASRRGRFDQDRARDDRPTFNPGNRDNGRNDDNDRGRDRSERTWPDRHNDSNERFNRGNRENDPGRNNWSGKRRGRDG